jgi:hypothetical protein
MPLATLAVAIDDIIFFSRAFDIHWVDINIFIVDYWHILIIFAISCSRQLPAPGWFLSPLEAYDISLCYAIISHFISSPMIQRFSFHYQPLAAIIIDIFFISHYFHFILIFITIQISHYILISHSYITDIALLNIHAYLAALIIIFAFHYLDITYTEYHYALHIDIITITRWLATLSWGWH